MKKLLSTLQTFSNTGKVDHEVIKSIIDAKNKLVLKNNSQNPNLINTNPNFHFPFNTNMKLPFLPNLPIPNIPLTPNVNFPLFNNLNNDNNNDKFEKKFNNMNNSNMNNMNNMNNLNNMNNNNMNNNLRPPNYKTKPCRNFHSEVGCNREEKCHFIHDINYAGN